MTDEEEDFKRETDWRELARSLFVRLSECQPIKLDNVTTLPKLPSQDELDAYAARFRALSTASGWTSHPKRPARRWWWPF